MFLRLVVVISVAAFIEATPGWRVLSGEYKSLRQVGDQVEAEYEKLHPDGSVTRRVASGDINKGLTYSDYKIDPEGRVHRLEGPEAFAPPVDRLGPSGYSGYSGYPGETGVSHWKPEQPRLGDVKMSKNPLKDFFQDIFRW